MDNVIADGDMHRRRNIFCGTESQKTQISKGIFVLKNKPADRLAIPHPSGNAVLECPVDIPAGLFSHALSTHEVANDVDYFSAVDEEQT